MYTPYLLLNSLFKESELSILSDNQIRILLRKLLKRNDISHQDLFKAVKVKSNN